MEVKTLQTVNYGENIVVIPHFDSLKIFCFSFVWGVWIIVKRFTLKLLKSSSIEWTDIDNPPSCLFDVKLGQHLYIKIRVSFSSAERNDGNKLDLKKDLNVSGERY